MEQLESELDLLIKKLRNSEKFSSEIDTIQNVIRLTDMNIY